MAIIQAFTDKILQIDGVKNCIFVRNDGHVIVHNVENPGALSSMVAFSGLSCDAIKSTMGTTYFRYLSLIRASKEKFFIFPVQKKYFLGILIHSDAYPPAVIDKVLQLLEAVISPKKVQKQSQYRYGNK